MVNRASVRAELTSRRSRVGVRRVSGHVNRREIWMKRSEFTNSAFEGVGASPLETGIFYAKL
jgi:hypothetical protein